MNCVSVAQLVQLAACKQVAVPAELGGCIVLAAADQLLVAPMELGATDLHLFEDGLLRLSSGREADPVTAEGRLRELLGVLLGSASSVTPALLRAARRKPIGDMQSFVQELEIALVPTNRGASKRALARLCREARRAVACRLEQNDLAPKPPVAIVQRRSSPPEGAPNIPDLDVPRSSANDVAPAASVAACSIDGPKDPPSMPGVLEIADVDVIELIESVECPSALCDTAPASPPESHASSVSVLERTAPFPLTRVIGPADPGILKEPRAARPTPAGSIRRYSRIRKPLFPATRPPLDQAEMKVETVMVSVDLVRAPSVAVCPVADGVAEGENAGGELSASRRQTITPELKAKQPVVGPHRFVARPCFAKKPSKVAERVREFGDADKGDSDQLVDSLHTLANGGNRG